MGSALGVVTLLWEWYAEEHNGFFTPDALELALMCREAVEAGRTGWHGPSIADFRQRAHRPPRNLKNNSVCRSSIRCRLREEIQSVIHGNAGLHLAMRVCCIWMVS